MNKHSIKYEEARFKNPPDIDQKLFCCSLSLWQRPLTWLPKKKKGSSSGPEQPPTKKILFRNGFAIQCHCDIDL